MLPDFYLPLYNNAHCTKIILENKPDACGTKKKDSFTRASKVVSYIGGVRYIEILKNLVDAVKDNKAISLNIHGDGHDLVALKEYASEYSNVCFTGYYKQKISSDCIKNLIWFGLLIRILIIM